MRLITDKDKEQIRKSSKQYAIATLLGLVHLELNRVRGVQAEVSMNSLKSTMKWWF